ncbi:MAG: sulfatase-like hydrolase/transferase [Pseudomonadota bacterium]
MPLPNIILIMSDNQQAATLGCYGNNEIYSPHLDALAAQGLRFDRAFCPNSFCSPCRASTLTGMLPSQHGVHSWIDDRKQHDWPNGWHALRGISTLPERLQACGYTTGLFGKYHLGETATAAPGWNQWVTMHDGHVRTFYENDIVDNGHGYVQPGHAVDFFTDKALEFIASQSGPSFTYIPYPAPYGHWPATNDGIRNRHSERYDDCPMHTIPRHGISTAAVANYDLIKSQSGGGLDFSMLMRAPNHLPTLRNYYSQISLMDEAVGRIADANPDALIIFTADHGLSLGHHGFWGHGASTCPSNLHLAAHSIPMIIRTPHGNPGSSHSTLVSNMDLFATILDYVGTPATEDLPSRSFANLLNNQPLDNWGADELFAEQEETRVIRTAQWTFFKRFNKEGSPELPNELYDAVNDREETTNLANNPEHQASVQALSAKIDQHFDRYARAEADLWRGGKPIQNTMVSNIWQQAWGNHWAPVYAYD